jgi:hypothetical protein
MERIPMMMATRRATNITNIFVHIFLSCAMYEDLMDGRALSISGVSWGSLIPLPWARVSPECSHILECYKGEVK